MLTTNEIYNQTWQEGFKSIPNNSIDLIITSPPYNLGGEFHTGSTKYDKAYHTYNDNLPEDVYQEQQIQFLNACYDKLSEGGSMFYNHKPRIKKGVTIHPLSWILQSKFILKQEIIWKNRSQNFDKIRFYPFTERIYWLTKNSDTKLFNAVNLPDIWEFKNRKRHPIHKATFPIELPLTILQCFPEANLILDPYMGIGTTAKAVQQLNRLDGKTREYLGFEIDRLYVDTANQDLNSIGDKL